ncbi:uncharacterized protein LOC121240898 [Juglans microcarpa x Juglans regia]|uniref:uncharacterized protein LOC121240898 n=1 Tax=Juglans microcarpa x Juglans regia TaxID=2249226 RepID=UPI001B7ED314|nr:uncharacterized protein LOC121240898 [Juglans microcarpa x Juglans regia]
MRHPRNVFIRMSSEENCMKALSREVSDIDGVPYRPFHWTTDFKEEEEPSIVPVWIVLPGLPPNYYHESFLKILTAPIGRFIRRDNPTRCATRTDGARICVEMDVAKEPLPHFWIGTPGLGTSCKQEIIYETLPAFCSKCKIQDHNAKTCCARKKITGSKVWVRQQETVVEEPNENMNTSVVEEPVVEEPKENMNTPVVEEPVVEEPKEKEVEANQDSEENLVIGESSTPLIEELEPEKDHEEPLDIEGPTEEMTNQVSSARKDGRVDARLKEADVGGKIWVFWKDEMDVQFVLMGSQYLSLRIKDGSAHFLGNFVYAKCNRIERQLLWEELNSDRIGVEPCLFAGDFNIIRSDVERCGSRSRTRAAMDDFNRWIHQGGLMEMSSQGGKFTWCNGQHGLSRAWAKLDRVLLDANLLSEFLSAHCSYLSRTTSDHSPMFIEFLKDPLTYDPSPFRFQQMWVEHPIL